MKYTYEKKKEYSAEILAKLSDTKNKMIAYPKLYIKTPTKDLINVKGSISGKPGSNIRVVITEDKLFRTPISVKGKWAIGNITTPPPHTHTQTYNVRNLQILMPTYISFRTFHFYHIVKNTGIYTVR